MGLRTAPVLLASTLLRIILVPALMALVLQGQDVLAAVVFVVAAATDFFDGYFARRWGVTTTLGSFLDTTADKLLVAGVLVALVAAERVSPWATVLIVGREIVILGLRGAVAAGGDVIQPSVWGKIKTAVQFLAILLALLRPGEPLAGAYLDEWAIIAAAVVTVLSGADYLARFSGALRSPDGPPARRASAVPR